MTDRLLEDLSRFMAAILRPFHWKEGALSTDEVVFDPNHLLELMSANSIAANNQWELHFGVQGRPTIAALLEAALGDWVDFVFLPFPEPIAIYADHDEYTTFFFKDQSDLTSLASELVRAGFWPVPEYIRPPLRDKLR